jgi:molecular chaperone HscA
VNAGAIISAVTLALAADSNLISDEDKQVIETEIHQLQSISQTEDAVAINKAVDSLNHATEAFAAARMNASVSRALSGKNLDSINL